MVPPLTPLQLPAQGEVLLTAVATPAVYSLPAGMKRVAVLAAVPRVPLAKVGVTLLDGAEAGPGPAMLAQPRGG